MACNICGSLYWCCCDPGVFTLAHVGWECPVCHKGNAPDVKGCVHCVQREPLFAQDITSNGDLWASGKISVGPILKISIVEAGDMSKAKETI